MNSVLRSVFVVFIPFVIFSQNDFYSADNSYGGGVGFSQMYLFMNVGKLDGFELLSDSAGLGLNTSDFSDLFIMNGGEGFSQITGKWRIGGYAGLGSSSIGGKTKVMLFIDSDTSGSYSVGDTSFVYQGNYAPDIRAKVSMWIGGATVEYALPIFKGLEISAGTLVGLGRTSFNIVYASTKTSKWDNQFSNIYGEDGYYEVTDFNGDTLVDISDVNILQEDYILKVTPTAGSMTSLSGTFLTLQPYAAVKLQFLDRVGIRISVGFNLGKVNQGGWVLNDGSRIADSPTTSFNALAIRAMIYFGL